MEVRFDCECGREISDFTRGDEVETGVRVACDECGATYAVTITQIQTGSGDPVDGIRDLTS